MKIFTDNHRLNYLIGNEPYEKLKQTLQNMISEIKTTHKRYV